MQASLEYQEGRKDGRCMDVSLIFKIAAVGILVSVVSQVLKQSGREETEICRVHAPSAAAPEKLDAEYAQEVQTEEDHHQAGEKIDGGLVGLEGAADGSGQSAHGHEGDGKAQHESCGAGEGAAGRTHTAACEVGDIDGQHGQQTGGEEGDDALQKGNEILHEVSPLLLK